MADIKDPADENSFTGDVEICELLSANERSQFLRLPDAIYREDPLWVPPLRLLRAQQIAPSRAFFEHAHWKAWLARRAGRPVGRISAQIDRLHLDRHHDGAGFFGMLEAIDDPRVFNRLFEAAEAWLRAEGMRRLRGPFTLSINEESGLLVEGFDTPPMIMMGHARPYYASRVLEAGYLPVKDLLAYRMPSEFPVPPAMRALAGRAHGRIRLRPLQRRRRDEEFESLRQIFNDAWSENWGFVPFTEAEFREIGRELSALIPAEFVQIAEVDGEPGAMIVMLPNINEAIRDLHGRLLPFGWLKLLWRLKRPTLRTARVTLMGVRKEHQQSFLGPVLVFLLIDALRAPARSRRIDEVEMSWVLEDNLRMRRIIEGLGGVCYKRYRLYEKDLEPAAQDASAID
jgi:hypothetical protein